MDFNVCIFLFQIQLVVSSITIFIINICIWWNSTVYYSTKSRWMGWERDLLLICFNCVKDIHAGFLFNFLLHREKGAEQSVTQIQSSLKPALWEETFSQGLSKKDMWCIVLSSSKKRKYCKCTLTILNSRKQRTDRKIIQSYEIICEHFITCNILSELYKIHMGKNAFKYWWCCQIVL